MKIWTLRYVPVLLFVITSCDFNQQRDNIPTDIEEAELLIKEYHDDIKAKSFESAKLRLTSNIRDNESIRIFLFVDSVMGRMLNCEKKTLYTRVIVKNEKRTGGGEAVYKCTFEKGEAEEKLVLEFENDTLKISGFNTNMPFN